MLASDVCSDYLQFSLGIVSTLSLLCEVKLPQHFEQDSSSRLVYFVNYRNFYIVVI